MNTRTKTNWLRDPRRAWFQAFVCALPVAALIFLPFVIMDHGMFLYYGDFNVQQIPFYQLVHRAVRSGGLLWNWYTDLGANFIGSYSFYNLFSPFFWLTLPFPTEATPYLMAPLLVLKTACASATGCLFISRFTRDHRFAVIGGLLYAFSGFTTYNIFFNHFHEVIVVFPLLLYALERLVVDGRRGYFALAVALNAFINYWFFIGTVVFVVLYVVVRTASRGWDMTPRKFLAIAVESVAGVLIACAALLPSALAIMGNPRTTADNLLYGWGFWLYGHEQRLPAILASIFFPPDIPSRPNFFPDHGAKWASLSAWLPMIGPSFVIGYLLSTPRSWVKRMLWLSLCLALVPGFNALFILLNNSYYARWFYMPVLLMSLASVLLLERFIAGGEGAALRRGMRVTLIVTLVYTVAVGLTPTQAEGEWEIGLEKYPERFWLYVAIVLIGLLATWLVLSMHRHPKFFRIFGVTLGCACAVYSAALLALGRAHSDDREWMRQNAVNHTVTLPQEPGEFARSDIYNGMDNLGMFWGLPNIQAFHSIVPVSLMEFYPSVGVKRDVSSKPEPEIYALRSLLSVKWLFVAEDEPEEKQPSTPYFTYSDTQLGYNIYVNDNYLPMGFGYDQYVTRSMFEDATERDRVKLLHKGVLIEDEDVRDVRDIVDRLPREAASDLSDAAYLQDIQDRRRSGASFFERDNRGFTSRVTLESDQIVFYSVPFDTGWTAAVNGEPTKVLKVNGGFLGVPANAGENEIRFDYLTPGLKAGCALTAAGLLLLAALILLGRRRALCAAPGVSRDRPDDSVWERLSSRAQPRADGAPDDPPGEDDEPFVWGYTDEFEDAGRPGPDETDPDGGGEPGPDGPDPEDSDGDGGGPASPGGDER